MTALDLLREARAWIAADPWEGKAEDEVYISLLRRIDALLDAPQEPCPACEARARETVYGWGVVDREGRPVYTFDNDDSGYSFEVAVGDNVDALYAVVALDRIEPARAPHRVVELVARPVGERE